MGDLTWVAEDIDDLNQLKQDLADALDRLEYAQSMGWPDRAAEEALGFAFDHLKCAIKRHGL